MLLRCERQCAFSVDLSKIFLLNIFTVHILAGKKKKTNINQVKTIKTAVYFMFVTKSNLLMQQFVWKHEQPSFGTKCHSVQRFGI